MTDSGSANLRVIEAIYQSSRTHAPVPVKAVEPKARPSAEQEQTHPPHDKRKTVSAAGLLLQPQFQSSMLSGGTAFPVCGSELETVGGLPYLPTSQLRSRH